APRRCSERDAGYLERRSRLRGGAGTGGRPVDGRVATGLVRPDYLYNSNMTLTRPVSIDVVRRAMGHDCPGLPAQLHMSPPYREQSIPRQIVNPNHGGVLILLYPGTGISGELSFVLMRRTDHLDHHKGQT